MYALCLVCRVTDPDGEDPDPDPIVNKKKPCPILENLIETLISVKGKFYLFSKFRSVSDHKTRIRIRKPTCLKASPVLECLLSERITTSF